MFFSVPGSHPGYYITFTCGIFLGSSLSWQFLRLTFFLEPLTVLRGTVQVLCKMTLNYDMIFSLLD